MKLMLFRRMFCVHHTTMQGKGSKFNFVFAFVLGNVFGFGENKNKNKINEQMELISARKTVTRTQKQRPESPMVTLTRRASKHKVRKVHEEQHPNFLSKAFSMI